VTNRRDALRGIAALPPLIWAGSLTAFGTSNAEAAALPLERFVFDVRFAEAGTVAEHVGRQHVRLAPMADDLMALWYDDLDLAWRKAPMALAGMTLAETLFVLETFALDRAMQVVYRGEHGVVENGRIAHRFAGPAAVVERLSPLVPPWESALAAALMACPLGASPLVRAALESEGAALSLRDMPLVSWIIAPRTAGATRVEG
jgi:hypothetical protein